MHVKVLGLLWLSSILLCNIELKILCCKKNPDCMKLYMVRQTLQGYVFHMSEILRSATPNLFILTFTQIVMYTRHEKKRALYLKNKMSTIYSKMIK